MRSTAVGRAAFNLTEYKWGNPQVVRQRAERNYARIVARIQATHQRAGWEAIEREARLRKPVITHALPVMHNRTEEGAVRVYQQGKILPSALVGMAKRFGTGHTRSLDKDLELDRYVFTSFRRDVSFGPVVFVLSNRVLERPDSFVTADDISSFMDMDSYDEVLRSKGEGIHSLSSWPGLEKKLAAYSAGVIPGARFIDLLSLVSVTEFSTFEDFVKMLLRGATHYGLSTAGMRCYCLNEQSEEYRTGHYLNSAEGKFFGELDLTLLEEILVDHPITKEELIARGLPADLITVVNDIIDSQEERFRLDKNRFSTVYKPQVRGMMRWAELSAK